MSRDAGAGTLNDERELAALAISYAGAVDGRDGDRLAGLFVEDGELAAAAAGLAARLAAGPAGAYGVVKRLLAESLPGYVEQMAREGRAISMQAASPEGAEGISAFLAKRAPRF